MKRNIRTFQDVEIALRPYIPLVKELTGRDTMLDRIKPLMEFLGHPENKLKTIHIAGTSGKTSTSYYISSLLILASQKVGLSVSPHIDKISERTQLNGRPLAEATFCAQLSEFLDLVDKSQIKPSYFELVYAFSIWLFAKLKVDYAVIETGVGGLHDATNIVNREDKVCVITDIGFDHMSLLGNTLAKIAAQKVGIVHKHNPLLMYRQGPEVMSVIQPWVKDQQAKLYLTTEASQRTDYSYLPNFNALANYQKRNWLLAYYVYRFIAKRDGLAALDDEKLIKSHQIKIPARMDATTVNKHHVIMDGAHNHQKMSAFISSYKALYPNIRPAILLAFKSDKAYLKTLKDIVSLASEVIVTSFKTSQDLPVVSAAPEKIAADLMKAGAKKVRVEADHVKAYRLLLNSPNPNLVITGSFYLIAQIRQNINHD